MFNGQKDGSFASIKRFLADPSMSKRDKPKKNIRERFIPPVRNL
jgi:hypothetical protein